MGFDFLWLLPIHPIGKTNRKGSLGSPYSIDDFRQINPEYGTLDDFSRLISEVHRYDLRLMMDIVFRHTSHDCHWVKEHPQWYLTDQTVGSQFIDFSFKETRFMMILFSLGKTNCFSSFMDRYFRFKISRK